MKDSNSTGFDEIPSTWLKSISSELAPPLSYLINLSMESGNCPILLKNSIIKPFFMLKRMKRKIIGQLLYYHQLVKYLKQLC